MTQDAASFLELQTATGWRRTLEQFADWCVPQPGWWSLDVGSGPGLLPALLARRGCRALGVDLDFSMFSRTHLHPALAQADARHLPFPPQTFDLITASNLLFFLPDPHTALLEMARLITLQGQVCLLNPSERMDLESATRLADARGLRGLARQSLQDWAKRAERHARWDENDLSRLLAGAGLRLEATETRMGPGLARLARARRED